MKRARFIYKIHPAIGIGRVGNADADRFFLGPETPGLGPTELGGQPVTNYKDGNSGRLVRRQAVRFRIWEYELIGGMYTAKREIHMGERDVRYIRWKVHLANKKASFRKFDGLSGLGKSAAGWRNRGGSRSERRKLWEVDYGYRRISGKNKKGAQYRFNWDNASGQRITVPRLGPNWLTEAGNPVIPTLGELRTDAQGRLIVIGGKGMSVNGKNPAQPPTKTFNNDDWFDDVSDGPVTAEVGLKVGRSYPAWPAWVIIGPPDFAPYINHVVTLYDVLFDIAARQLQLPRHEAAYKGKGELAHLKELNDELHIHGRKQLRSFTPVFERDIWPLFQATDGTKWVFAPSVPVHTASLDWNKVSNRARPLGDRSDVWKMIRPPPGAIGPSGNAARSMPKLRGDEAGKPLTVTRTQYEILRRWRDGRFTRKTSTPPPPPTAPVITPHGLDRAALEAGVGGAFYPGIEVGWQIRDPKLYLEPFRISHKARSSYTGVPRSRIQPGHFTRQMALPWQTDFLRCDKSGGMGWWPAQRPVDVQTQRQRPYQREEWTRGTWPRPATQGQPPPPPSSEPSFAQMVERWASFGFVLPDQSSQIEKDRDPTLP